MVRFGGPEIGADGYPYGPLPQYPAQHEAWPDRDPAYAAAHGLADATVHRHKQHGAGAIAKTVELNPETIKN